MASNIVEELNAVTASDIGDEVATSSHENEIKLKFYEELVSVLKPKQNVIECRAITEVQIQKLIQIISEKDSTKRDVKYYYYSKRYYVVQPLTPENQPLLAAVKEVGSKASEDSVDRIIVSLENMWKVCWKVHRQCSHNGVASMEPESKKFYHNVTRTIIKLFLKYSEVYQTKKNKSVNHGLVVRPLRSELYNSRVQIDLIDMQSLPCKYNGRTYKFILNCQDHLTKFIHLRPLEQKTAFCVANELYLIFCEFGPPVILQSDNGTEFRNEVVTSLKVLWSGLSIVHGRARRPQTQGSVEKSNGDMQNDLNCHMREHKSTNWVLALPLIQYNKNRYLIIISQHTHTHLLIG